MSVKELFERATAALKPMPPEERGEVLKRTEWGDGEVSLDLTARILDGVPLFGAWLNCSDAFREAVSAFYFTELEAGRDLSFGINPLGDRFPTGIMGPDQSLVVLVYATMGTTIDAYHDAMLARLP